MTIIVVLILFVRLHARRPEKASLIPIRKWLVNLRVPKQCNLLGGIIYDNFKWINVSFRNQPRA